jgi:hypothetical protein
MFSQIEIDSANHLAFRLADVDPFSIAGSCGGTHAQQYTGNPCRVFGADG